MRQDVTFWTLNGLFVPNKNFFRISHYYNCHALLAPFIIQNFKKTLTANSELWAIFWVQNGPFAPNKYFLGEKLLILFSSTYWPISLCKIFKILTIDPEFWGCTIFGPKMGPFAKTKKFSDNLFIHLVRIIHAYLHSENQIQLSIYWWNIGN